MITREEILRGEKCPPEFEANLAKLLTALNQLRILYGKPMIVTSGYRTWEHNRAVGGATNSAHLSCQAVDFADADKLLSTFCMAQHQKMLIECDLYMENPIKTRTWCHLQIRPTKSRVFNP